MSAVLWLNDLPLWTAALVIIGGTIALSIIGTAVSGLFFGEQALSLNNVVGGFKYMFVAGIYAGTVDAANPNKILGGAQDNTYDCAYFLFGWVGGDGRRATHSQLSACPMGMA